MPPKKNLPNRGEDAIVLVWTDAMIDTFLRLLEEAHDNGKRSDTGFKPEARIGIRAGVQAAYLSDTYIAVGKIRSKLDYVCEHS